MCIRDSYFKEPPMAMMKPTIDDVLNAVALAIDNLSSGTPYSVYEELKAAREHTETAKAIFDSRNTFPKEQES